MRTTAIRLASGTGSEYCSLVPSLLLRHRARKRCWRGRPRSRGRPRFIPSKRMLAGVQPACRRHLAGRPPRAVGEVSGDRLDRLRGWPETEFPAGGAPPLFLWRERLVPERDACRHRYLGRGAPGLS